MTVPEENGAQQSDDEKACEQDAYLTQALYDVTEKVVYLSALQDGQQRNLNGYRAMCAVGKYFVHGVLTENEFSGLFYEAYKQNGLIKERGEFAFRQTVKRVLRACTNDPLPPLNRKFLQADRRKSDHLLPKIHCPALPSPDLRKFDDSKMVRSGYSCTAVYQFFDDCDGAEPAFEKLRYEHPDQLKRFLYRHKYDGSWYLGRGDHPDYPYNFRDIFLYPDTRIVICEGEKDADNAKALGLLGISVGTWEGFTDCFANRDVIIVPDNDAAGQDQAQKALAHLQNITNTILILSLPDLKEKQDFSDWIEPGGNRQEFDRLVKNAQLQPTPSPLQNLKQIPEKREGEIATGTYPMQARAFLDNHDILYIQGDLYKYSGTHWEPLHEDWLCKMISDFQESIDIAPTIKSIREMKTAVLNAIQLERQPDRTTHMMACKNGVVNLDTGDLQPHSPDYMFFSAVDYAYDPDAEEPVEWLKFLNAIWPNPEHKDCIPLLQRIMGYLLSSETKAQKIFQLVGPPRSGKGTIGRVIGHLIGGSRNTTSPSLQQLQTSFGLQSAIDKKIMLISEANIRSRNVDRGLILDTLLRISGEDEITIARKNRQDWIGRLTARILFMTNDVIPLSDAARALLARMIILPTPISFVSREDFYLEHRLNRELGAILKWSIAGWQTIKSEGFEFRQPETATHLIKEQKDCLCPLSVFIEECCILDPEARIPVQRLYDHYRVNCNDRGVKPVPRETMGQIFTRDAQGTRRYGVDRRQVREQGKRVYYYFGIGLTE